MDDSPSVRAVLRRFLRRDPELEVTEAVDGEEAVASVLAGRPDVVLMDLEMPVLDGYAAIDRIMAERPTPVVVLSSRANRNQMQTAFEAMRRGALEVLPKPEDTESWHELADELPAMLRAAVAMRPHVPAPVGWRSNPPPNPIPTTPRPGGRDAPLEGRGAWPKGLSPRGGGGLAPGGEQEGGLRSWSNPPPNLPPFPTTPRPGGRDRSSKSEGAESARRAATTELPTAAPDNTLRIVAIGASTGGPAAILELLAALSPAAPCGFAVVQHIASGFELGFADWLNKELPFDVRLAADGEALARGAVRIAPGGSHLLLTAGGILRLDTVSPPRSGHRPAVDELFLSCAACCPRQATGVLMTGMGADGVEGLLALYQAGGVTLVQDEASSVIFGMPKVALERGAATLALPPRGLAQALARSWNGGAG